MRTVSAKCFQTAGVLTLIAVAALAVKSGKCASSDIQESRPVHRDTVLTETIDKTPFKVSIAGQDSTRFVRVEVERGFVDSTESLRGRVFVMSKSGGYPIFSGSIAALDNMVYRYDDRFGFEFNVRWDLLGNTAFLLYYTLPNENAIHIVHFPMSEFLNARLGDVWEE
jgi:hypothetical protein